ncbi:hypothetical protein ACKFKG_32045 [Phormidesmis sp. 146-35]
MSHSPCDFKINSIALDLEGVLNSIAVDCSEVVDRIHTILRES